MRGTSWLSSKGISRTVESDPASDKPVHLPHEGVQGIDDRASALEKPPHPADEGIHRTHKPDHAADGPVHPPHKGVQAIDERVQAIDERVQAIDERVQAIDERVQAIDERVQAIDERVQAIDERVQAIDERSAPTDEAILARGARLSGATGPDTASPPRDPSSTRPHCVSVRSRGYRAGCASLPLGVPRRPCRSRTRRAGG